MARIAIAGLIGEFIQDLEGQFGQPEASPVTCHFLACQWSRYRLPLLPGLGFMGLVRIEGRFCGAIVTVDGESLLSLWG